MCRSTAPASAEPPPITPLTPYFAMTSKARSEPLWIGCQHSTGSRHQGDLLEGIAAIPHRRRDRPILALVRERLALECLEQDLEALLEHLAVGVLVEERRAKLR